MERFTRFEITYTRIPILTMLFFYVSSDTIAEEIAKLLKILDDLSDKKTIFNWAVTIPSFKF